EKGMADPVRSVGGILADEAWRGVAVIAGRHRTVRRLEPAVELFAHDVAVGAGCRIVSEVGPTLGIREGIDANPDRNAEHDAKQNGWNPTRFHLSFRSPTLAPREGGCACWPPFCRSLSLLVEHIGLIRLY